ncbi:acyltransferase [Rubrivivax gelatinosus]|nr:acyltransferase [Rubrivivax gelatinosus]
MRQDIQSLRGLAIALVVLFHAAPVVAPGGYLGVEVFFVVSGYLLARSVGVAREAGRFRYGAFVLRRLRRLAVPAAVVLLACAGAGSAWLTAVERSSLWQQTAGAATFTANVVLWLQGGYFDQQAATKPLLHTWALAVIAQAAALLALLPLRRRWLLPLLCASFAAFVLVLRHDEAAAYFLTPFRLWEFVIGMLVAGAAPPAWPARSVLVTSAAAVAALVWLALRVPPGASAAAMLAACLLSALLLWLRPAFPVALRPLAWLGAVSYPLYLVHWPVLAFLRALFLGDEPPASVLAAAVAVSLAAAVALHLFVERPPRRRRAGAAPGALGALLLIALLAASPSDARAQVDWQQERRPNVGFAPGCDSERPFVAPAECMSAARPQVLVWGDSTAMQWVPGLVRADVDKLGLAQATMSTCGPLLGVAPVYTGALGEPWARRCIAFNDSVLAWLRTQPQLQQVLLASIFGYHIERGQRLQTRKGVRPQSVDAAYDALMQTVAAVRAAGKRVSVVAPLPATGFDVGACLERQASGRMMFGRKNCDIERQAYERAAAPVLELLRRVEAAGVRVVRPERVLCDAKLCRTSLDGVPLYRDKAHLSYAGSVALVPRLELLERRAPRAP